MLDPSVVATLARQTLKSPHLLEEKLMRIHGVAGHVGLPQQRQLPTFSSTMSIDPKILRKKTGAPHASCWHP
jgi:hypothetical protein